MRETSPLRKHIEESPKLRELRNKRQASRRRLKIFFTLLIITVIAGLIYAAHYPQIQLTTILVSGNKVVDSGEVVAAVEKDLAGNYAYIIPRRNAFLYPKKKIIADLTVRFPRFKDIAVYRENLDTLQVSVTEVRGKALWCGESAEVSSGDTSCYFTDENGKIVAAAPYYSGNVYPRFFGGVLTPNNLDPIGKTFITSVQFQKLLDFQDRVFRLGLPVKSIMLGNGDEDSFVIDIGGDKTAIVRFLANDNYQLLASNLAAALGKDELKSALQKDKANLLYFDLRFTNKVYYKFSDK